MTTFADLGLSPTVLAALAAKGYEKPTPIQEQAIPVVLMMRDVIGIAQTGTGKTAGFTLPMIEILNGGRAKVRMPRSLVLSPTRELAAQISENFATYGVGSNLSHALLVGGESMVEQTKLLNRGVDVLIATPGRMLDLYERGQILLNDIKILVIDEADRMLDMGFIPDIERIIGLIPPASQKLLFSATMPPEIQKLAEKFLRNPKTVRVDPPASPAETVEQHLVWTETRNKRHLLRELIKREDVKNAFIFCNRKIEVSALARYLAEKGLAAAPMHGDMVQAARNKTLQEFKDGVITLMVCSDVAARGLDIKGVSHVFNYDVPFNADDYVHRIGRTGRAGLTGRAWTLACPDDDEKVVAIEKLIRRPIPPVTVGGLSVDRPASDGAEPPVKAARTASSGRHHEPRGGGRAAKSKAPVKDAPRIARARTALVRDLVDDQAPTKWGDDDVPAFLRGR
jgi:superfamily II DNA/RNA helicase